MIERITKREKLDNMWKMIVEKHLKKLVIEENQARDKESLYFIISLTTLQRVEKELKLYYYHNLL